MKDLYIYSVFAEARARIGAEGYTVRDSASYASAVYSGVFCLLAIRDARDWRLAEQIELQNLEDHHIFPRAYLNRHGLDKRAEVNSVVNRTLLSDETNGLIRDKAPADYLGNPKVFPKGPNSSLLEPHFIGGPAVETLKMAAEQLPDDDVAKLYGQFSAQREAMIIRAIRDLCGVAPPKSPTAMS